MTLLEELMLEDFCLGDDIEMSPREVFAYLNRVIYNRRTKWVIRFCHILPVLSVQMQTVFCAWCRWT